MTVLFPEAEKAQGNTAVVVAQTIANPLEPKLTEINAVTSVNASCFLYSGGVGTSTQNKGEAPARLCTTDRFQQFGNTTFEVSDLQYVYSPQGDDEDDSNSLSVALEPGTEVWLVVRRGPSATMAAFAVGQKVDLWHVEVGVRNKTQTGDGEFDEFSITQVARVISRPIEDVALVV